APRAEAARPPQRRRHDAGADRLFRAGRDGATAEEDAEAAPGGAGQVLLPQGATEPRALEGVLQGGPNDREGVWRPGGRGQGEPGDAGQPRAGRLLRPGGPARDPPRQGGAAHPGAHGRGLRGRGRAG
ncbi:unnamed protein product, partial [Heterosigma akashiwo]